MSRYAAILAVSSYLPSKVEKNDATNRMNQKIGVMERHISADDEAASDLAVHAAEELFRVYHIEKERIDFLLLCLQHPDYQMPTTACQVQARLGLSEAIGALDYNLGCSGYVYGLSLAKGLIEGGMAENVLLITSSIYTKYINSDDKTIRPLFGDGATATLISAVEAESPLLHSFVFGTDGSRYNKLIIPTGGSRHQPRKTPEIFQTDEHGNTRSNYEVYMDGAAITFFSMRTVPGLVSDVLKKASLEVDDLDGCVFHQANRYMLEKLRARCGLDKVPFYNDIEHIGNTVSGTIPFALEAWDKEESISLRRRTLLAGFGVGLSWAGCIADFSRYGNRRN